MRNAAWMLSGRLCPVLLLTTGLLVSGSGMARAATSVADVTGVVDQTIRQTADTADKAVQSTAGTVTETVDQVVGDTSGATDPAADTVKQVVEGVTGAATETVHRVVGDPAVAPSGAVTPAPDNSGPTPAPGDEGATSTRPAGGALGDESVVATRAQPRTVSNPAGRSTPINAARVDHDREPLRSGRERSGRERPQDVADLLDAGNQLASPAGGDPVPDQSVVGDQPSSSDLTRRFLTGALPFTGFALYLWVLAGFLLLAGGAASLAIDRRQQTGLMPGPRVERAGGVVKVRR